MKEFTFDMAHRLQLPYESPCTRIHGHTYKVQLFYKADYLDDSGMVRDFSDVKKDIDIVKNRFDHQCLVATEEVEINRWAETKTIFCNPTAENMAQYIFNELRSFGAYQLCKVCVWETPTAYAEYQV
jgi:6-pyruvoyltetrahydropterin/6-carboxytetrahydropterin synthase